MTLRTAVILSLSLLALAAPATAQTQPPSAEDLQRDNQAATGNQAAQISAQNAQLQQQMQADRARQQQIFANQPNVNTPNYAPPVYRAPVPPPAPKPPLH